MYTRAGAHSVDTLSPNVKHPTAPKLKSKYRKIANNKMDAIATHNVPIAIYLSEATGVIEFLAKWQVRITATITERPKMLNRHQAMELF